MVDVRKRISEIGPASALTGDEILPVVQGGATRRASVDQLVAAVGIVGRDTVGLGNVDNTSDADKPVSAAQRTALDLKAADAARPVLACIGDSRLAQSLQVQTISGSYTAVNSMPIGPMAWVGPLTSDRVYHPFTHNLAVSGSTSADALAAVPSVAALNPKPTHCALLTGTNDLGASVPVATVVDNIVATWQALRDEGIEPIGVADLPRSVASWSLAGSQQSAHLNYLLRESAREMKVAFVDATEVIADPANADGDPRSGYTYDGLHPATPGAYHVGSRIAALFTSAPSVRRPASRADVYNATNNPYGNGTAYGLMTGTAGTRTSSGGAVSGNVADGWNVRSLTGAGTAVCSKVTRTDAAGDWQQVVLDSAGGVSTYRISLITTLTASSIGAAPGDLVFVGCDFEVEGSAALEDLMLQCDSFDGTTFYNGSKAMKSTLVGDTYYPYNFSWSGRVVTHPHAIRVSTDQLIIRIEARVNTGAATLRIGSFEVRKAVP